MSSLVTLHGSPCKADAVFAWLLEMLTFKCQMKCQNVWHILLLHAGCWMFIKGVHQPGSFKSFKDIHITCLWSKNRFYCDHAAWMKSLWEIQMRYLRNKFILAGLLLGSIKSLNIAYFGTTFSLLYRECGFNIFQNHWILTIIKHFILPRKLCVGVCGASPHIHCI